MKVGDTATVIVDGEQITGTVYHLRENGWPCVESDTGRIASGPTDPADPARSFDSMLAEHGW